MSLPIIIKPFAEDEFEQSVQWYENRQPGVGLTFEAKVQATLSTIEAYPDRYPIVLRNIREAPVDGFPFSIYFQVRPNRIDVLSIFHQARNPSIWQGRA